MSKIFEILKYEEGYRSKPYIDTEGYPTIGIGFLIGPKGAKLSNYTCTISERVAEVWLQDYVSDMTVKMNGFSVIKSAIMQCNEARKDILMSMAYQMGIPGLASFTTTLGMLSQGQFTYAADNMLKSKWASQTPARAKRHAQVIRDGTYDAYKGIIK